MIPAAQIQSWAESLAPIRLADASLAAIVVLSVVFAVWRARRELPSAAVPLAFLGFGAAALELASRGSPADWRVWLLTAATTLAWVAIAVSGWRRRRARTEECRASSAAATGVSDLEYAFSPSAEDPFRTEVAAEIGPRPAARRRGLSRRLRAVLAGAFLASALLLFDHLGSYAGTLVHWESPVLADGFAPAFIDGVSFLDYARMRTIWDNGILSRGDTSLFFGLPTYVLLRTLGFDTWTLRIMSALTALLSMVTVYALGRRFFSPRLGVAAAVLFGLSSPVLLYGRYGSSISGTLLAVLLALYAVWALLARPRAAWWLGPVCALALFVATLQYAPARLFVLFVLGYLPLACLLDRSTRRWQMLVGLFFLAAAAVAVLRYEESRGGLDFFLHARGEQFFELVKNPGSIQPLAGIDVGGIRREDVDWRARLMILGKLLQVTIPQYRDLVWPRPVVRGGGRVVIYDPPDMPLYFAPLGLFIALGIAYSLPRWRSWRHLFLLAFPLAYTVPLLLTNRVDTHRAILLVLPFTLWAALGVREVARLMTRLRVPRLLQAAVALPFLVAIVYEDVRVRYPFAFPEATTAQALAGRIGELPGSVALGLVFDHRERSWLELRLMERRRRDSSDHSLVLADAIVSELRADRGEPRPMALRQVEQLARRGTLLLGPLPYFRGVIGPLQNSGLRVAEERSAGIVFVRADAGAGASGVPDGELRLFSPVAVLPTPTPPRLRRGRKIWLSDLQPSNVSFGFAQPRINTTWNGGEVRMGGVLYERAIGTHAWTKMTYAVPTNAVVFEAIVGLSDEILGCERASVVFEVLDHAGRVLATSGVVDASTPPQLIVARLRGEREIVLSVTDAGDGRDCDHANWGSPAFALGRVGVGAEGGSRADRPGE